MGKPDFWDLKVRNLAKRAGGYRIGKVTKGSGTDNRLACRVFQTKILLHIEKCSILFSLDVAASFLALML